MGIGIASMLTCIIIGVIAGLLSSEFMYNDYDTAAQVAAVIAVLSFSWSVVYLLYLIWSDVKY